MEHKIQNQALTSNPKVQQKRPVEVYGLKVVKIPSSVMKLRRQNGVSKTDAKRKSTSNNKPLFGDDEQKYVLSGFCLFVCLLISQSWGGRMI